LVSGCVKIMDGSCGCLWLFAAAFFCLFCAFFLVVLQVDCDYVWIDFAKWVLDEFVVDD